MKLIITIGPVDSVYDAVDTLRQIADKLPAELSTLQPKFNIVSTRDHETIIGTVEFIQD